MQGTVRDRAQALLAEAEAETGDLEARRQALITEREAEVAAVRERFRARLDEIEAEIKTIDRLRKALDPESVKREAAAKREARKARRADKRPERQVRWTPKPEVFAAVLRAIDEGSDTATAIYMREDFTWSRGTAENTLAVARQEGLIRLAGLAKGTGRTAARRFAVTPQGQDYLEQATNGSDVGTTA